MLSVVLTVFELQRLGLAGEGVEAFFHKRGKSDGKSFLSLETVDDQFKALAALGEGKEDQVILHSLNELKKLSSILSQIKQAWRAGDNDELMQISLGDAGSQFPAFYESLLVQRNQRWMPKLERLFDTPEVKYVLVGALHLAGPDSVLAMLEAKGYRIEKLSKPAS